MTMRSLRWTWLLVLKKLKSLKARLARNKDNTPLYNTEQFTRDIETAYTEMYKRYVNGEKPEHLLVKRPWAT